MGLYYEAFGRQPLAPTLRTWALYGSPGPGTSQGRGSRVVQRRKEEKGNRVAEEEAVGGEAER